MYARLLLRGIGCAVADDTHYVTSLCDVAHLFSVYIYDGYVIAGLVKLARKRLAYISESNDDNIHIHHLQKLFFTILFLIYYTHFLKKVKFLS